MEKQLNSDLRAVLKEAAELVSDLDESIRPKAFEIAVAKLSGTVTESYSTEKNALISKSNPIIGDETFLGKISEKIGIDKPYLEIVYRPNSDGTFIINTRVLTGHNIPEKQRQFWYIYLLAAKYGQGREFVTAPEFAKQANKVGLKDKNTGRNLEKARGIIISGNKRGVQYKLSPQGLEEAISLLKIFTDQSGE